MESLELAYLKAQTRMMSGPRSRVKCVRLDEAAKEEAERKVGRSAYSCKRKWDQIHSCGKDHEKLCRPVKKKRRSVRWAPG